MKSSIVSLLKRAHGYICLKQKSLSWIFSIMTMTVDWLINTNDKKNSRNSFLAFLFFSFRCFDVDFRNFLLLLFILRKTNWHRTIVGPEIDNTFATSGQKMMERRRIGDKEEKMKVMLWFVFAFFLSIDKEVFFVGRWARCFKLHLQKKIKHSKRPYLLVTHSRQEINYATHALIIKKTHNKFIILNINRDFKSSIPLSAPRFKPSILWHRSTCQGITLITWICILLIYCVIPADSQYYCWPLKQRLQSPEIRAS